MLGGFTRSLSALVHFTLHTGAGVDSVVYMYSVCRKRCVLAVGFVAINTKSTINTPPWLGGTMNGY
jgi:hypothetical protein